MGKRGPPPKPSALKKLEGTHRPDRVARREMSPPPGTPECPKHLCKLARQEWERVVPLLEASRVLTLIDQATLADYCAAHALAIRATRAYRKAGLTIVTPQGILRHPAVGIAIAARAQARLLAAEFGMTPAARTRVSTPEPEKKEDKAAAFLFDGPKLVKPA